MKKLILILVLVLSSCSSCDKVASDLEEWQTTPLRDATLGDMFAPLLFMFVFLALGTFDVNIKNWKDRP